MKCQDMGDAMAGVKECLLVLGKLTESTSSTASILFGHPGDYTSIGAVSLDKKREGLAAFCLGQGRQGDTRPAASWDQMHLA